MRKNYFGCAPLMLLCVSVMCEKCEMEMKKQNGLREIIMMVGVAHELTSDFNQMVEYHIKNACVKKYTEWNEDTESKKRDFIYRNNRKKKFGSHFVLFD